jgi:hypothetical protein
VVTRSLVPLIHFSPIKNPPSIATGGLPKPLCVYYTYTVDPSETPKRYSRHSLMLSINICLVANFIFSIFPCFLRCVVVILVYLSLVNNFFSFLTFFYFVAIPMACSISCAIVRSVFSSTV